MSMAHVTERELHSFLDQKLCEMADALMRHYDCCGIDGMGCKAGKVNPCCLDAAMDSGMCEFWKHGKCQFENCDCKLWLCETAIRTTDEKCVQALRTLEDFAQLFGLAKAPFIGQPYTGADQK